MILIKSTLSKKDRKAVDNMLYDIVDIYGDFYLTQDNLRLSIKENSHLFYKLLKNGDKVIFDENGKGMAVIIGYAEKSPRKYLKILAKNNKIVDQLLKNIDWRIPDDVYCKIKKKNPLKTLLLKNKFKFIGNRGSEILLVKKGVTYDNRI